MNNNPNLGSGWCTKQYDYNYSSNNVSSNQIGFCFDSTPMNSVVNNSKPYDNTVYSNNSAYGFNVPELNNPACLYDFESPTMYHENADFVEPSAPSIFSNDTQTFDNVLTPKFDETKLNSSFNKQDSSSKIIIISNFCVFICEKVYNIVEKYLIKVLVSD